MSSDREIVAAQLKQRVINTNPAYTSGSNVIIS